MSRGAFRQADLERIFRAAKTVGSIVKIDLRTLVVTVIAREEAEPDPLTDLAPDGKDNFDD
ncbi:hypothetical protein NCHU2750_27880 [Neorhizobium sp. NCHU2750]|nr:hypothetical protein NCHU2750_27880 [Neorhizobium sp. NCHU2750]